MKILIAIDERRFANDIVEFVINHKWASLPDIKVINVVEVLFEGSQLESIPAVTFKAMVEEQFAIGKQLTREVALKLRDAFHLPNIEEQVIAGHPRQTILSEAERWKADLIIVGSHGRHGIGRIVMGSVSSAVVAEAPCSVLVVRVPVFAKDKNGGKQDLQKKEYVK